MSQIMEMSEVIAARRKKIRDDAPCEGCGATKAACEANRGKDPTAPSWFGCCARGSTASIPCRHHPDGLALTVLLDEIERGVVRTVEEITPKRRHSDLPRPDGAPGTLADMLDQDVWWRQKSGAWIKVADMSPGHRYNTAAMILRVAGAYAFRYVMQFAAEVGMHDGGDLAHNSLERELDMLHEKAVNDPRGWMRGTKLYKALAEGLAVRGDGTESWQNSGFDPVSGLPLADEIPPRLPRVCEIPACGCSGEAHA